MIVFRFGMAFAALRVDRVWSILPFRPLSSPMLRIAAVPKPRLARHKGEPVRCSPTSALLPNIGGALNDFLAVITSVPTLSPRRSGAWRFED